MASKGLPNEVAQTASRWVSGRRPTALNTVEAVIFISISRAPSVVNASGSTKQGLTALQKLDPSDTQVADLGPVQDLPNLKAIGGAPDAEKQRFDAYRAQKGLRIVSDNVHR
jgi:hypothetical protein